MLVVLWSTVVAAGEELPSFETLETEYQRDVRPLVNQYCISCHSTEHIKGELDLERFTSLNEVRRGTKTWLQVVQMLDLGEMPPVDSPQLSLTEQTELRGWVERYLHAEALAGAGDPGPVVLRRLTNAEYTWTIRDLTKVNLSPVSELPTEGAAGEGFTNTGHALVMSPGLLRKYFDAAKQIAEHAVLVPDGIRFSPHATRRDWTDEILAEIRTFYARFTATERLATHYGHDMAHLGNAGRLPLTKYFAATLAERDSLTTGDRTIEAVAADRGLNARYLRLLWGTLTGRNPSPALDDLRSRWQNAKLEDAESLSACVLTWQNGLWTFNPVGLLGRKGSRSRWLEPIEPLLMQQELRFSIPLPDDGQESKDFSISLVATDAGDGNDNDFVLWQKPRFVVDGQPDILLRDVVDRAAPPNEPVDNNGIDETFETASSQDTAPRTLTASMFGTHPDGGKVDDTSLCVRAPAAITIRVPSDLAGREFVTTAALEPKTGSDGSVQPTLAAGSPDLTSGLLPSEFIVKFDDVNIGADRRSVTWERPILVSHHSASRKHFESAFDEFRNVFPAALCYSQIVPVDETLTLTLFYREDDQLARLMLDDAERRQLDRLWHELYYVSHEPLRLVDVLDSLLETTIDHPQAGVFDSAVKSINERADAFRQELQESEAKHILAMIEFAARAWRRPITNMEETELRTLYRRLRDLELPHEEAFRLTLSRVFVASPFLYRLEVAPAGPASAAVSDWELASRLSYFLWSSTPDDELRTSAASGLLTGRPDSGSGADSNTDELLRQTRRMLQDERVRRLASEFAGQWLHIHRFDPFETKSETHFPEFVELRSDMYEESLRFFTDLFQHDASLLSLLDADHTFVNARLADFYGIPQVEGDTWRRVEGIRKQGRGGILGLATTLAKQSGTTRTSPILRGNWVSEVLLGERLPRPPKNVPQLTDAVPAGLTVRQLIERHTSDEACAKCHRRIDPFGFALEEFDAIGRRRPTDARGLPINSQSTLPDGTQIEGLSGLRSYLLDKRRDEFLRQFCRKLLGYAIGRELQLSDQPLLDEILVRLSKNNFRFSVAVETIVLSPQFRMIRGRSYERSPQPK
ncbi:MAG: DUF1592 domain-containing protein [Planctomycetaceae bacterium]